MDYMDKQPLEHLNDAERHLLIETVPKIALLIAGADGTIDEEEIEWAEKLVHIRSYAHKESLRAFYGEVEIEMDDDIRAMLQRLSKDPEQRQRQLTVEISKVNAIFPKLPLTYQHKLYNSLRSFARHVAKAGGGILFNLLAIDFQESKLVDLPMINMPAPLPEDS